MGFLWYISLEKGDKMGNGGKEGKMKENYLEFIEKLIKILVMISPFVVALVSFFIVSTYSRFIGVSIWSYLTKEDI
jgi:hypothetical protein